MEVRIPKYNRISKRTTDKFVLAVQDATAEDCVNYIKAVTADWNHPVNPVISKSGHDRYVSIEGPGADAFGYLDQGTKDHTITARPGKHLRFRVPYKAKTSPGGGYGISGGGVRGKTTRFAESVFVTGVEPRKFIASLKGRQTGKSISNRTAAAWAVKRIRDTAKEKAKSFFRK
jgi:hypothetical protein